MRGALALVVGLLAGCSRSAGADAGLDGDAGYVTCSHCGFCAPGPGCGPGPCVGLPCDPATFYDRGDLPICEVDVCAGGVGWDCFGGVVVFNGEHGPCGLDAWSASLDAGHDANASDAGTDAP